MNQFQFHIPIPNSIYQNRQFCTYLPEAYLKPIDPNTLEVFHEGMKVKAGIEKEPQKHGDRTIYYSQDINPDTSFDYEIDEDVILLYDDAGLNYAHFFFDFFGKCLYFEEIRKTLPKLKIGILENFYSETGNSTFIKQWLDLYFEDKDVEIIIFKNDQRYKIKTLILPNSYYWFPEGQGEEYIIEKIMETVSKIPEIEVKSNGCYISRQDTLKRGWYHGRDLVNEIELIEQIQNELGYDIIELMDYDIIGKIQIFKSYKNIVQQSSASNIGILFSNSKNTHTIISNPRMAPWLNAKVFKFSQHTKANLITLDGGGEYLSEDILPNTDVGNYPWKLTNIEGIIEVLKQIDNGDI